MKKPILQSNHIQVYSEVNPIVFILRKICLGLCIATCLYFLLKKGGEPSTAFFGGWVKLSELKYKTLCFGV